MNDVEIKVVVNGKARKATVPARLLLCDFIRQDLTLPGTHIGCEHGVCGACTVLLNDEPVRSCLMFAAQVDGCDVTTVESMGRVDALSPIQEAFWEEHGLQCGFCTPGMLLLAQDLLKRNPNPTEDDVREVVSDNLCRCTGYQNIINSVLKAATKLREAAAADVGKKGVVA